MLVIKNILADYIATNSIDWVKLEAKIAAVVVSGIGNKFRTDGNIQFHFTDKVSNKKRPLLIVQPNYKSHTWYAEKVLIGDYDLKGEPYYV